jgi:hypothetical protein
MNTEVVLVGGMADGKRVDVPLHMNHIVQFVYPPNVVIFPGSQDVESFATYPQVYRTELIKCDHTVIRIGVFETLTVDEAVARLVAGYKTSDKRF